VSLKTNGNNATGVHETGTLPSASISVCCFVKLIATTIDGQTIFQISDNTGPPPTNFLEINSDATNANWNLADSGSDLVGTTSVIGQWYFLAASSVAGGVRTFYCQVLGGGMSRFQGTAQASYTPSILAIGGEAAAGAQNDQPSNACIAGVRVWNGIVLSQAEFAIESESILPYNDSNLILAWPLINDRGLTDIIQGVKLSGTAAQLAPGEAPPGVLYRPRRRPQIFSVPSGAITQFPTWYPDRIPAAAASPVLRESGFFPAMPPIHPTFSEVVAGAFNRQSYPERLVRAAPNAALLEAQALGEPPIHPTFAEVVAFAWGRQSYPERVLGARLMTVLYWQWDARPFMPERTSTYLDQDFPDRVVRPFLPPNAQQYAVDVPPLPERTAIYIDQDFPERVPGPRPPLPRSDYVTEVGSPERSQTYLDADFPDRVTRPFLHPTHQQFATENPPAPETKLPGDVYTSYPDITRAGRPVAQYRENAWVGTAVPERTSPLVATWYPERFEKGGLPTPEQFYAIDVWPFPIATSVPTQFPASYPERALRAMPTRTLPEWAELATPPILPTFSDVQAQAWGRQSYPDRALCAVLPTAQQQAALDMWPLPVAITAPTSAYGSYPDQLVGPPPPRRDYLTEVGAPERTAPLAATLYPDQILGAPPRKDYATEVGAPEAPVASDWYARYPDQVLPAAPRRGYEPPFPIQPPPITRMQWSASYPDALPPRVVRTLEHLAERATSSFPRPNVVTFEAFTVYPDSFPLPPRFALHASWSQGFLQLVVTQIGKLVARTAALTGVMGSTYALPSTEDKTPAGTGNMGGTNA
jgi:Concanavalin A-like lectin/glucanases superfamily